MWHGHPAHDGPQAVKAQQKKGGVHKQKTPPSKQPKIIHRPFAVPSLVTVFPSFVVIRIPPTLFDELVFPLPPVLAPELVPAVPPGSVAPADCDVSG